MRKFKTTVKYTGRFPGSGTNVTCKTEGHGLALAVMTEPMVRSWNQAMAANYSNSAKRPKLRTLQITIHIP